MVRIHTFSRGLAVSRSMVVCGQQFGGGGGGGWGGGGGSKFLSWLEYTPSAEGLL